jgi:20S proteasome alpha/beta subunit
MTLLIGILCSDGAVIAADKQATHGALGMMTVGQQITKISAISGSVLFASSGYHGMSQQFEAVITPWVGEEYFTKNGYPIAINRVQQAFRPIVEGAFKTAQSAAPILGHQAAQADCICGSIFAAAFKDGMKVVEITPQIGD